MTERELILTHRQLLDPRQAAADLLLLQQLQPGNARLAEYRLSPGRYADAILLDLLQVATAADVSANRQPPAAPAPAVSPASAPVTLPPPRATSAERKQKEDEYPAIRWQDLSDPDVQQATILYNDRINTWRRMKEIDVLLERKPTERLVAEMAELRMRNLLAFDELKALNDTGRFLFKHPLLESRSELSRLRDLLSRDADKFLRQHKNVLDNIKRYKAFLKRADRKAQRQQDRERLEHYQQRDALFRILLEQKQ